MKRSTARFHKCLGCQRPRVRNRRAHRRRPFLEPLENRRLLAFCSVAVDDGNLTLVCDDDPNEIVIEQGSVADEFMLRSSDAMAGESIIIGDNAPDANFMPFGGHTLAGDIGDRATRYQQVYSRDEFAGPVNISEVKFFHVPFPYSDTIIKPGSYHFEFSVTDMEVDALNTNDLDVNVTGPVLGTGLLESDGIPGGDLVVDISDFTYDPAQGNLLMDIKIPGGVPRFTEGIIGTAFKAFSGDEPGHEANGIFSRADNFGSGFEGWGLKTEFLMSVGTDFGAGPGVPVTISGVTGDITIQFGAADDTLAIGVTDKSLALPGDLKVEGGGGDNQFEIGGDATDGSSALTIAGDVEISNGDGNNYVKVGGDAIYDYGETVLDIAGDVEITNGNGDNITQIGGHARDSEEYYGYGVSSATLHIGGDVEIENGDGENSNRIGGDAGTIEDCRGEVSVQIDGDVEVSSGHGSNHTSIGGYAGYEGVSKWESSETSKSPTVTEMTLLPSVVKEVTTAKRK